MRKSSLKGLKTLWEKEKLLITSNFSFSLSVFKRLLLQTRKNQGLFGKGLTISIVAYKSFEIGQVYIFVVRGKSLPLTKQSQVVAT